MLLAFVIMIKYIIMQGSRSGTESPRRRDTCIYVEQFSAIESARSNKAEKGK